MTVEDFSWQTAELDSDDQALVEAYERTGIPLDALAYTPEFRELVKLLKKDSTDESELHSVFTRLLNLRKRGLLPRIYQRAM